MADAQRFLVKMRPDTATAAFQLGGAAVPFELTPLFPSIEGVQGLDVQQAARWYALQPKVALDGMNDWDVCHALVGQGLGIGGEAPAFAEPDMPQRWVAGSNTDEELALNSACSSEGQDVD